MKSLRLFCFVAMILMSSAAFAWNCSDPLASRVDVGTTKPSGSAGDGDGQYFLGTGSEGTKGHYYVCEVPKTHKDPKGGGGACKGHSCNSSSNSGSSSSSSSSATGGSSTSTATGGTAVSSSGVNNSGNSSNTNTNNNTAQGGAGGAGGNASQGQKQGQSQTQSSSSNNSGGNSSNSYSSTENVAASKIPVDTAYAPTALPTSPCFKGFGAGVQTMPVGASFGGGKIDPNCAILETARNYAISGSRRPYCTIMASDKYAFKAYKKAHKGLNEDELIAKMIDECMYKEPEPEPQVVAAAPTTPQVVVVPVQSAPAPAPTPAVVVPVSNPPVVEEIIPVGICTFASKTQCVPAGGDAAIVDPIHVTSVCKEMIDAATAALARHPGYVIVLRGNRNPSEDRLLATTRANRVKQQFEAKGVKSSQIKTIVGTGETRTVQITLEPAEK